MQPTFPVTFAIFLLFSQLVVRSVKCSLEFVFHTEFNNTGLVVLSDY